MRDKIVKNFVAVTIAKVPKIFLIDEDNIGDKIINPSPIFHSWLRHEVLGIVGVKFSSWMINQSFLSKEEKELVNAWNKSESDFEIYFSKDTAYDSEKSIDEVVKNTAIIKLDKTTHGLSFPLFGASMGKQEIAALEAVLARWNEDKVAGAV